jgi:hypothetical protein
MATHLSFAQVASLISAVGGEQTVIVQGPMGIGKTAIYHHLRRLPELRDHIFPGIVDCTQLNDGSMWMPGIDNDKRVSFEMPNERFGISRENQKGVNGARPVVLCFDELGKATQYVKNMTAPMLYERRIGDMYFPEGSLVFATTNMEAENLGDSLQAHLRNRVIVVKMRGPSQSEWRDNYAIPNGLAAELIAATEMFPQVFDTFVDYEPGGKYAGKALDKSNPYIHNPKMPSAACTTPRSLSAAAQIIDKQAHMDDDTLQAALAGRVGESFAADLAAFIRFGRDIPVFDRVIADPTGCPVPDNATAQIVQVMQFVTRVESRAQAEKIVAYVQRMRPEMVSMFINTVARSATVAKFATVENFGALMAEHRMYS